MQNVFITTCILHNMLLKFDGYDIIGQDMNDYIAKDGDAIEEDVAWPEFDEEYSEDEMEEAAVARDEMRHEVHEEDGIFDERRHALIAHYNAKQKLGPIFWRKTFKQFKDN